MHGQERWFGKRYGDFEDKRKDAERYSFGQRCMPEPQIKQANRYKAAHAVNILRDKSLNFMQNQIYLSESMLFKIFFQKKD
jgi:hypothetical protein